MREVNALGETLRQQRLGALEATALLRKVMEEIDVAVFAFDGAGRLRLVNRAGERILNQSEKRLLGLTAGELGLLECLEGETPKIAQIAFPGKSGRWEIHRGNFREAGLAHQLLVITAWGSLELAVEAMRRGAKDFIQKPWENARLLAILKTQIELSQACLLYTSRCV